MTVREAIIALPDRKINIFFKDGEQFYKAFNDIDIESIDVFKLADYCSYANIVINLTYTEAKQELFYNQLAEIVDDLTNLSSMITISDKISRMQYLSAVEMLKGVLKRNDTTAD